MATVRLAFRHAGKSLAKIIISASALLAGAEAVVVNNYPIVLVHEFLGFGPTELQGTGFKYWGGFNLVAGHMQSYNGTHEVFAAGVGPVSSNWDRAVELYYQINGGGAD